MKHMRIVPTFLRCCERSIATNISI